MMALSRPEAGGLFWVVFPSWDDEKCGRPKLTDDYTISQFCVFPLSVFISSISNLWVKNITLELFLRRLNIFHAYSMPAFYTEVLSLLSWLKMVIIKFTWKTSWCFEAESSLRNMEIKKYRVKIVFKIRFILFLIMCTCMVYTCVSESAPVDGIIGDC